MPDIRKIFKMCAYLLRSLAIAISFLFVFLRMNAELHDPDIWLHLKAGEYILQHKIVPHHDIFSFMLAGKEWVDHSWLVQIIYYLTFHAGGPDALVLLASLIMLAAFFFLLLTVGQPHRRSTLVILALSATVFASNLRYNIRPENFSVLFFAIYLLILTRFTHKRAILLLPLVQLLWVNCHGFFILGPLLIAVFIAAEAVKRKVPLPWDWKHIDVIENNALKNLVVVFFLSCAVSFVNPNGCKGVFYPIRIILNSGADMHYSRIIELLPTLEFAKKYGADLTSLYILTVVSFLSFALNFRSINIAQATLWLIFFGMAYSMNRNLLFFNFVAFLTTVHNILRAFKSKPLTYLNRFPRTMLYINYLLIVTLFLWTEQKVYKLLNQHYYIYEESRVKPTLTGLNTRNLVVKAADFIATHKIHGNMFNMFNYGAYLIYRTFPERKVFVDGRTELYGHDFFINYEKILDVDADTIEKTLKNNDIHVVVLSDVGGETIDSLSKYFFNHPRWVPVYFDKDAFIFVKNTPMNKDIVDKYRIDFTAWKPEKVNFDKIQFNDIFPEPYIKRAWKLFYLGLYPQAEAEAREALKIITDISEAYNIIGMIYTHNKSYEQAFQYLRLGYIYLPHSKETLLSLGEFYMAQNKFDEAIGMYKKLTQTNPYYFLGFYNLGKAYASKNEVKLAVEAFKKAIALRPYYQDSYKALGNLFHKQKAYPAEIKIYKDALKNGINRKYFSTQLSLIYRETHPKKPLPK